MKELICEKTGNPSGTDTWRVGFECPCAPCQRFVGRGETSLLIEQIRTRKEKKADAIIDAAREYFEVNDDGHDCGRRDGTECPSCTLKDALREYDQA